METAVQSRAERERAELEQHIQDIRTMRGLNFLDVVGYVYRMDRQQRNKRTSCGKVFEVLDDDEFGRQFGPGSYHVQYMIDLLDGQKHSKSVQYEIGREYMPFYREYCELNGIPTEDISRQNSGVPSLLNRENVESIVSLVGAFKAIMGGDRQSEPLQMVKAVLELMPKPQAPGESVVSEAMRIMRDDRKNSGLGAIREQMDLFNTMKEVFASPEDRERAERIEREREREQKEPSPMEKILGMALEVLPSFLDRFSGNIPAAAAQLQKEQPTKIKILQASPALQRSAFDKIKAQYGTAAANQWSANLGLKIFEAEPVSTYQGEGVISL
jgi:hypothetical protein